MDSHRLRAPVRLRVLALAALIALLAGAALQLQGGSAQAHGNGDKDDFYQQTNLVADQPGHAAITDPNLVNPWGIVAGPTSPFWISDNGTGLSTLYNGQGQIVPLVVTVPAPTGSPAGTTSTPTGIVFNGADEFHVSQNGVTGASVFIFSTEDGTISGWSPTVNRTNAILTVDNSRSAVYKGLALASTPFGDLLYAANFHDGTVDVFDANFKRVHLLFGAFKDFFLPRDYAPFGIANIGGRIYVSYARQDADKHDDVAGPGHGFVDVYDVFGHLLRRLVTRGALNSPWGMVVAPKGFGQFSGDLLVGNFGDGRINVYNPWSGRFVGTLRDQHRRPIVIDGLWGLTFGNGAAAGPTTTLFFTAGPDDESHGLFGQIVSVNDDD